MRDPVAANARRWRLSGSTVILVLWLVTVFVGATFAYFMSLAVWSVPRDQRAATERLEIQAASMWVTFAPGSTDLHPDSVMDLRATLRRAHPESSIAVMGFAHEQSDLRANLDLADSRAHVVAAHLLQMGIIRERIKIAAAEAMPVEGESRSEIRFMERVSSHASQ